MNPPAQSLDGGAPVGWALVGPALVSLAPVRPAPTALQARCCSSIGTGLHTPSAAALALTVLNLLCGACWGSGAGTKLRPSQGLQRCGTPQPWWVVFLTQHELRDPARMDEVVPA